MLNPYFKNMRETSEIDLSHSLVEEVIQLTGMDVYYIKSEQVSSPDFDTIFGENRFEQLNTANLIEMYPRNFEMPFNGGDLFTKFGVSMNQQITFEVAYRRFERVIGGRPREGDYIFIPATTPREMNDIFKIQFVDTDDEVYNPQGTILKYVIKCERANFTHQELATGVARIDNSMPSNSNELEGDREADNEALKELSDMFLNFDEQHPFGNP